MPPILHSDIATLACGCLCDDLQVTVEGDRVVGVEGGCEAGKEWLLRQGPSDRPAAEIDGKPAELDAAIGRAVELLQAARSPLICGLTQTSTAGQRSAVRLAERLGGTIDWTTSPVQAASQLALQEVGLSTASLGEIRHRCDLVIFLEVDPAEDLPCLLKRFVDPPGEFVPAGRRGRTVVVLDSQGSATGQQADLYLRYSVNRQFELVEALRLLLAGHVAPADAALGIPPAALEDLLRRMKTCRSGVIFYGQTLREGRRGDRVHQALFRLVESLNAHARFYAREIPMWPGNSLGASNVLAWQTGFPLGVSFAQGYPRYDPHEFLAASVLARGEADLCLAVGTQGVRRLPREAIAKIPLIVLAAAADESPRGAAVRFTTDVYGLHRAGTAYRFDDVAIPLRAILPSRHASDDEILDRLFEELGPAAT